MTGPQDRIDVPARPAAFGLDPSAMAVVVVDMQNDFAARGGMFDRAGIDISSHQAAILAGRRSHPLPVGKRDVP